MDKVIGDNIRKLREKAGFTQKNLAMFMKVDQSMISKIEKGERSLSTNMVDRLSALFGVPVDQMENGSVAESNLSFAFRGSDLTVSDMEVISAVNKIALNSEFMSELLEEGDK